ncbi:hypothetical protein CR513_10527, partial [Mucuna pruriens]
MTKSATKGNFSYRNWRSCAWKLARTPGSTRKRFDSDSGRGGKHLIDGIGHPGRNTLKKFLQPLMCICIEERKGCEKKMVDEKEKGGKSKEVARKMQPKAAKVQKESTKGLDSVVPSPMTIAMVNSGGSPLLARTLRIKSTGMRWFHTSVLSPYQPPGFLWQSPKMNPSSTTIAMVDGGGSPPLA